MSQIKTQRTEILARLMIGQAITPLEALNDFGCFRLGARIYDLREQGYDIATEMVEEGSKRYARYFMSPEAIKRAKRLMSKDGEAA